MIAAKALGMSADMLQRILLFLNPAIGQSVERVHDTRGLSTNSTRRPREHMLTIWRNDRGAAAGHADVRADAL